MSSDAKMVTIYWLVYLNSNGDNMVHVQKFRICGDLTDNYPENSSGCAVCRPACLPTNLPFFLRQTNWRQFLLQNLLTRMVTCTCRQSNMAATEAVLTLSTTDHKSKHKLNIPQKSNIKVREEAGEYWRQLTFMIFIFHMKSFLHSCLPELSEVLFLCLRYN